MGCSQNSIEQSEIMETEIMETEITEVGSESDSEVTKTECGTVGCCTSQTQCTLGRRLLTLGKAMTETTQSKDGLSAVEAELISIGDALNKLIAEVA